MEFERWVIEHRPRMMSYALRLTKNRPDAEDLVQDAMVRAFRSVDPKKQMSQAYAKRIVFNLFMDRKRTLERRPKTVPMQRMLELDPHFDAVDPHASTDQALLDQALSEKLELALSVSGPGMRDILREVLRGEDNLVEAARSLGIPTSTLRTRLMRARRIWQKIPELRESFPSLES